MNTILFVITAFNTSWGNFFFRGIERLARVTLCGHSGATTRYGIASSLARVGGTQERKLGPSAAGFRRTEKARDRWGWTRRNKKKNRLLLKE